MLARIAKYNKKAEEIMREGREHLYRKVMCDEEEGMKMITKCDRLWKRKSKHNEEKEEDEERERCEQEKDAETLEYRRQQYGGNPDMAVTGEDLQTVLDCDHCGPDLTETVRTDCDGCGRGWVREDYSLCIIGNDVISLFPSLDSITTGKIVREEVARSTIEIEGFNTRLGLRYIAMNEEYTSDLGPLRRLLPTRMTKPGVKPTMKCKWVNNKEVLDDEDWVYPPLAPTAAQIRLITGHVAEIGTHTLFENFV